MACLLLAVVCTIICWESVMSAEQMCSKFDYELRTLEVMLRTEKQVEAMLGEMKTLKESVTTELGETQKLKAEIATEMKTLKESVTTELGKTQKLKAEIATEMKTLKESVTTELGEKLKAEIATDMESMKDAMKALQVNADEKFQTKGPIVAFSVTNPKKSLVNGVPIFSDVITNTGNGYDVNTGVFKAPEKGLYLFVFTVASLGLYDVYCYLKLNGKNSVLSRTFSDNSYTSASGSAFLMLSTGDNVTIGDCSNWSKMYNTYNIATFSGALIQQA